MPKLRVRFHPKTKEVPGEQCPHCGGWLAYPVKQKQQHKTKTKKGKPNDSNSN